MTNGTPQIPAAAPKRRFGLLGGLGILVVIVVILALWGIGAYNSLNKLDQDVRAKWGQVENVYQRRADLVPNLVETVKGAASFERETYTAVTEARAKVGQIQVGADVVNDPEAFARFEQAQGELGSALSRLLVAVENYPELKATENFKMLQDQLEGTENRITQERRVFNESAQAFNTKRMSFPTVLLAGFFGNRFAEKSYFKSQPGADKAPAVKFD
ncbi:MAG: LemA family protein [Candidatus Aminicenantes bacterium]|nr:LemA family protein [Candidatus Aminicenantes bacterium]